ncbi:MAG: TonB-dependent receptor plug domain-containing protein [Terracidiphilus sp.]
MTLRIYSDMRALGKAFPNETPRKRKLELTCTGWLAAIVIMMPVHGASGQSTSEIAIHVSVMGEDRQPLAGVIIEGANEQAGLTASTHCRAITDVHGKASLHCSVEKTIQLNASLYGYLSVNSEIDQTELGQQPLEIVLSKIPAVQESVVVRGDSEGPLTERQGSTTTLAVQEATTSPLRPNTLVDALPMVPGVIRTPDGQVQISGMSENHSALIINSVGVNDPATGNFGLSVPVDTVDTIQVMQSPYLAQYGNFIAGVVSADTRRGSDKWSYSLNDPLPVFRIRSGHLEGLRNATPRLNFGGPLMVNRLYFAEGSEYLIDKAEVRTLPFPVNETRSTAFNSFTQVDALLGARNSVTATFHFAPHSLRYQGLNFFDPQPVTPNAVYQQDTGTVRDQIALNGGVISSTIAGTRIASNIGGQGSQDMTLTPLGNSGNYFGQQSRQATRFQWIETWNPAPLHWLGEHNLQIGSVLAHAEDEGSVAGHNVSITDATGGLIRTIYFSGNGAFSLGDLEMAAYAEDHWVMNTHLAVDLGLRAETQSITYSTRIAPRAGFSWTPEANHATVVRGGLGVFYDSVPLDTYAFSSFPQQVITTFDGSGHITDGPRQYINLTSTEASSCFPWIHQDIRSGDFAPYSVAWNFEGERAFNQWFALKARYLHAYAHNQLTLTPEIASSWSALVLGSSGSLQTRQMELTARLGASKQRQFFFSYVRQSAKGAVSDASTYLGDFPFPVVRSPITASTAGEIPNRFLLWGTSTLPWRMRITPHIEYRDGFTWQPVDQFQNYIPFASLQPRYPHYFSADVRIAKDLNLGPHHVIRLSITARNVTNHDNPLQVHGNTADPLYGTFFGNYGRHFLADFDFLF